jgi:hypothetical protein
MTQNNHYEHKLVNVGEEVDNLIESLREQNRGLQIIIDSKKDVPEDFEKEKKVYQFRIDMLEKQNKKLRDDMADAFKHSLNEGERVDYLEKVNNQHRFVFSEIPNNDFGRDFVNRMKYYLNSKRYRLRKRGQYLDDKTKETEGWKPYSDGQPLNKSKCIRVYIDCVANDTPEGFNKLEVDTILEGLDLLVDTCEENIRSWDDGEPNDDVKAEKKTLKTTRQLLSYFTEMKTHIEECQSNMGETNNVT